MFPGNCPRLLNVTKLSIFQHNYRLLWSATLSPRCPSLLTRAYPGLTSIATMKLTKRAVAGVERDPARDVYLWDEEVRGFGLRVKPSGVRSFIVQYRNASGVSRRITIGQAGILTVEEARNLAKRALADVIKGGDPAARRSEDRRAMTVRQLCHAYLDAAEKGLILGKRGQPKKVSTLYVDRGRIARHILPLLGQRLVRDVAHSDVVRFMRAVAAGKTAADVRTGFRGRAIVEGGRGTATRTVGLLGGILSFAVSEGVIPLKPARESNDQQTNAGRSGCRLSNTQFSGGRWRGPKPPAKMRPPFSLSGCLH